jgi:hypothetical protein
MSIVTNKKAAPQNCWEFWECPLDVLPLPLMQEAIVIMLQKFLSENKERIQKLLGVPLVSEN